MHLLVRAIITGFGLALGAALYKKVAKKLGYDDKESTATATATGSGDPVPST